MNNLHYLFLLVLIIILPVFHTIQTQIIHLLYFDVVDASLGLVFRYLSTYFPADSVLSFTVAFPMTWDLCYLIPINALREIPSCNQPIADSVNNTLLRHLRFLSQLISIGIGSAAFALSTHNSIQMLRLHHEIKIVQNSLQSLINVADSTTTQLLHVQQGQLKLVHTLNYTQVALNQTIKLVNQHSIALG